MFGAKKEVLGGSRDDATVKNLFKSRKLRNFTKLAKFKKSKNNKKLSKAKS